ncbi:hypothetical protein ES705_00014 [subsurface metagenome]|nr:hypothetical protein [Clostridia bacterium]
MNKKERIEAVIHHKKVDKIPWTLYSMLSPWGEAELNFRNKGLALVHAEFKIYKALSPHITITEKSIYKISNHTGRNMILRKFKTKVGEVYTHSEFSINTVPEPIDYITKYDGGVDQIEFSWIRKHPFKSKSDYEIMEYIYKNTIYENNYKEYTRVSKIVGSEGVVWAYVGKSPFSIFLYDLMGFETCFLELKDNPKKFRRLYEIIYQKLKDIYNIAAKSPALIVWAPDHLPSLLTPPDIFKEFYMPFYNEMADLLHKNGKVYAIHVDAVDIKSIAHLINETKIDIIEAFTPTPMGDLSMSEAREIWRDKIIWVNFPGNLLTYSNENEIEEYTINLLKSVAPGDNFILGCTENFPIERWDYTFSAIAKTLEKYGKYPIKI